MEINVLVNGILGRIGSTTARNVLRAKDMNLMPISVTACGVYRKASVEQIEIKLVDPSEIQVHLENPSSLLGYGLPNVVVDFSPDSFFGRAIPDYLDAKTSFVLLSVGSYDDSAARLSKMIKNLGVNIALLPEDSSEAQIMAAIRHLHQKNEANIFGQVVSLEEIAA